MQFTKDASYHFNVKTSFQKNKIKIKIHFREL
jgi:hypothetical protein